MLTTLFIAILNGPILADTTASSSKTTPSAQADAKARRYFENGKTLYAEGRYADSIVAFQEAYRLSGRHALLFNIASAQERLGDLKGAIDNLSKYRIHADPEEQAILGRRIDNLQTRWNAQQKQSDTQIPQPLALTETQTPATTQTPKVPSEPVSKNTPKTAVNQIDLRPLAFSLATISAVGLMGGTYFSIQASDHRLELEERCENGLCLSSAEAVLAAESNAMQWGAIGWGLGLLGGGAAVMTWYWDQNRDKKDKQ